MWRYAHALTNTGQQMPYSVYMFCNSKCISLVHLTSKGFGCENDILAQQLSFQIREHTPVYIYIYMYMYIMYTYMYMYIMYTYMYMYIMYTYMYM